MKEQMRLLYTALLLVTAIVLQACGGSSNDTVYTMSADVNEVDFSSEVLQESNSTMAIKVNYVGEGVLVGFAPGESPVSWLAYSVEEVTETSATVYINITNAQFLLPDTYSTTLRLATSNDDSSKFAFHDVDISLLVWYVGVDTDKVKFSGTLGIENLPAQRITIAGESSQWKATTDVDWLSLEVISGDDESEIVVTPNLTSFETAGLQQANIVLTETTSGDTKLVPVELALDNIYLLADSPSVSLTSTNTISALEKIVTVGNNDNKLIEWQASTQASWLTLTPLSNTQLKITADPSSAPSNASTLAQVSLSSSENASVMTETINVNFYNSDLIAENKVLAALAINNNQITASPLYPKFYVSVNNQLQTYHQYTGEVESSLAVSPEGTVLDQLIMHPAGDYLLAKAIETTLVTDEATGESTESELVHRYKINLHNDEITEIVDFDILSEPMNIVRLSGRYFVITQALEYADENLKLLFWDAESAFIASKIDVATQTNTLFALDNSSFSFKRFLPQVNDFGDDKIKMIFTHEYHPELLPSGQFINDFMVSNDETNIYALSQTSEWISFDGETFTDNGLLEASTNVVTLQLAKNSEGIANYLRFDRSNTLGFYLNRYDAQQNISSTTYTQGRQPTSIKVSGDDQRLIINVDASTAAELDSQIELVTVLP